MLISHRRGLPPKSASRFVRQHVYVAVCSDHQVYSVPLLIHGFRLFNEDGKTYAFDHRGQSGFARGEGVGCVVIKPLDAAIRDNDAIRAVVMSTGINQDGRTKGITVPNGDAQRDLIKSVYEKADLDPLDCGYAEMHGTGTKVGDPIETAAVHQALSQHRPASNPLWIGSVKTNVGHLEGTSGIVSLIKSSMMLERGQILPTANFEKPNTGIHLEQWKMQVPTEVQTWPPDKKYISVSNYGFGGANVSVDCSRRWFFSLTTIPGTCRARQSASDIDINSEWQ